MNKHIALSLLILSTAFTHTMEERAYQLMYESFSSFFSLSSYFPAKPSASQMPNDSQTANESELISNLRASKNEFESQLQLDKWEEHQLKLESPISIMMSNNSINLTPVGFLQYCYYHRFHINMLRYRYGSASSSLDKYRDIQIDGYSTSGAIMISRKISAKEKRDFIRAWVIRGFKPTPKDIGLAELILYDGIAEYQIAITHLLHAHSDVNWSVLPQEIRKIIAQNMIQLFKSELWLLPETALNNL